MDFDHLDDEDKERIATSADPRAAGFQLGLQRGVDAFFDQLNDIRRVALRQIPPRAYMNGMEESIEAIQNGGKQAAKAIAGFMSFTGKSITYTRVTEEGEANSNRAVFADEVKHYSTILKLPPLLWNKKGPSNCTNAACK